MKSIFAFILTLVVFVRVAAAQGALDPSGTPSSGTASLEPAFTPDPFRAPLIGGGDVDAHSRSLGQECFGFISIEPDFRVTAQGSFDLLRFIFISDTITTDTTMIVRAPDGRFLCNNDTAGVSNPSVSISSAAPGDYNVWIGGFTPGAPVYGDLYVTSNSSITAGSTGVVIPIATQPLPPTITPIPLPTQPGGNVLDASLPPAYGRAALTNGFLPDPYWSVVVGGGQVSIPALNSQTIAGFGTSLPACGGFTDSAPDFRLEWSGRSTRLRFLFVPVASGGVEPDASIVVQGPDGTWTCNRDFAPGFSRPMAEFINPAQGAYNVWIADEDAAGTAVAGVLYVTEITSTPETVRQAVTLPVATIEGLDAGEVTSPITELNLATDPLVVSGMTAGGFVNLADFNPDFSLPGGSRECIGHYSNAPSFVLNLAQPMPYLRLFFVADDTTVDPTLIVRMPDGQWYCNDDSFGTKSPTLNIIGNLSSGTVRVWAGSYDAESFLSGTLYVTRRDAAPSQTGVVGVPTPTLAIADTSTTPITLPTAVVFPTLMPVVNAAGLDAAAAPSYGMISLGAALAPYTASVSGGGNLDASALGGECVGYVAAQPDYRVQWSGSGSFLRFYMVSLGDTTLVVLSPDGTWHCNDDSFVTVNPTVDITAATPGVYNVWIGTYSAGAGIPGTLYITEDANRNPLN